MIGDDKEAGVFAHSGGAGPDDVAGFNVEPEELTLSEVGFPIQAIAACDGGGHVERGGSLVPVFDDAPLSFLEFGFETADTSVFATNEEAAFVVDVLLLPN